MQSIRTLVVAAAASLSLTALAEADTRIFIIDNSDGYGIDRCLSSGAPCGERIAVAWCRSHDYDRVIDFGRVAETAPTPMRTAAPAACTGPLCPEAVAITCSR
ncbi:hypothetical protein K9U40_16755 [Xanthobacter autotrophicus]|uniref:hypothetical protein n=1 Tax=Xanthobacter TaxID=279 RepID=UPI0024ABB2F3|nr:hypothetical protein [Xanthobacter autotrophicus]MDI4665960.1 hypothetical protein [Xanthobacter autotrophicus]